MAKNCCMHHQATRYRTPDWLGVAQGSWCAPLRANALAVAFHIAVVLLVIVAQASADDAPLAAWIPDDAALCLEFDSLPGEIAKFSSGPFGGRLRQFPPLAALAQGAGLPLPKSAEHMAREVGLTSEEMLGGLLGGRMALAVWTSGQREPGEQLVAHLLEAGNPDILRKAVAGLFAAEDRAGAVVSQRVESYAGQKYHVRVLRRSGKEMRLCLATMDRLCVVAGCERLMRRILDLHSLEASPIGGLASLDGYKAARAKTTAHAAVRAFVQPRAWDSEVQRRFGPPDGEVRQAAMRKRLWGVWQSISFVTATLELSPQPRLESFIGIAPDNSSPELADVLDGLAGNADFVRRLPADCLFAVAGHADSERSAALAALSPAAGQAGAVAKLIGAALGGLGPDAGLALLAPTDEPPDAPLQGVAGIRIGRRQADDTNAPTDWKQAVQSSLDLAVVAFNNRQSEAVVHLESVTVSAQPGWRLLRTPKVATKEPGQEQLLAAFGLADRYLLAGTSLAAVTQTVTVAAENSLAESAAYRSLLSPRVSQPGQVFYLNAAGLRKAFADRPDRILEFTSRFSGANRQQSELGGRQLAAVLALFDRLAATAAVDRAGIAVSITAAVDE